MRDALVHTAGRVAGLLFAPIAAGTSALRRSRMFHPRGHLHHAEVTVLAVGAEEWASLAEHLHGHALVRLSSAWWKHRQWPDALGCAIRFSRERARDAAAAAGDQDLLLATIRRPWTLPFAPLTTRTGDFFRNRYYGVSPFRTPSGTIIEWRLRPEQPAPAASTRAERLALAVALREATFILEARRYRRVGDIGRHRVFHPVVRIALNEPANIDQEALRFHPYQAGRGIVPVGFVNAMRLAAYAASQWARPARGRGRAFGRPVLVSVPPLESRAT